MRRRENYIDWKEEKECETEGKKVEIFRPNPPGLTDFVKCLL